MKLTQLNQLIDDGETIEGRWELDGNHEVRYRAGKDAEEIKLKASLLEVEPEALVLAVTQRKEKHRVTTSLLKLTGTWKLDARNRITFEVEKEFGKKDVLTFQGSWEVGEHQKIIYTYERQSLKTKVKELKTVVFKGLWDISERHRLTFTLGVNSESVFRFRGAFQTPSLLAKEGAIRYQVGVEIEGKKTFRTITLFGTWKLNRDLVLTFEMEYEGGRRHTIAFGAEYRINEKTEIEARLKTRDGKPLGLEVILTRQFLDNQGQAFLRLRKTLEESALEAGVKIPW